MENIAKAVERVRASQTEGAGYENRVDPRAKVLKARRLLAKRIVCHDGTDFRSRPFDMLRTQVLQSMDLKGWKIVGITSPTPGCGKTLTALNLAISIARQPERSAMLVDFDLRKPQVAKHLELEATDGGVLGILRARTALSNAVVSVRIGDRSFPVLPTAATPESSELMASRSMCELLREIRRDFHSHIVIVDLPPLLISDDVIAILPQLDCVLLVAAAGLSRKSDIVESSKYLESVNVLRVVLNKTIDTDSGYYHY
jgi:capsular exopolysaccharide synthesis family protein